MIRTLVATSFCLATLAACVPARPPQVVAVVPAGPPAKRITWVGSDLMLPDTTRVTPDQSGGFQLPNGDYVRRDPRGALILPTGARCLPDSAGYSCP